VLPFFWGVKKSEIKPYFLDHTWEVEELILEGHSYGKRRKKKFFSANCRFVSYYSLVCASGTSVLAL